MIDLLILEFKKFKNHTAIRLFGLMFLLTMPTIIFLGKQIEFSAPKEVFDLKAVYQFPQIWDWFGYSSSWLVFFFLGFIVLTSITAEVSYKTMRQNIITGMSRADYFLAKLAFILFLSVATTLLYTILGLGIGFYHAEDGGFSLSQAFTNDHAIFKCFLMCFGYTSFALMIGLLVRRSGVATFLYVCYIFFFESLIKASISYKFETNLSKYLPLNTIEDLFPNPLFTKVNNMSIGTINTDLLLTNSHAIIFSIVWIFVFLSITYFSLMRRDI